MELRHPTLGLKGHTQADEVCESNEAEELPPEHVPHSSQNGQMHLHMCFETLFTPTTIKRNTLPLNYTLDDCAQR